MRRKIELKRRKGTGRYLVLSKGRVVDSAPSRRTALKKQTKFLRKGVPSVVTRNVSTYTLKRKRKKK